VVAILRGRHPDRLAATATTAASTGDNDTDYIFGLAGNAALEASWRRPPTICAFVMRE